jgi:hypothetical protein
VELAHQSFGRDAGHRQIELHHQRAKHHHADQPAQRAGRHFGAIGAGSGAAARRVLRQGHHVLL